MKKEDFQTKAEITWCPGCLNFSILTAVKGALFELVLEKKIRKEDIVTVAGIGCHGKIYDYLNLSGFYALHGRMIPTALGIKLGNPELTVLGFGGDGDTFAEGISHFIHTCNANPNLTVVVHDNQTFALTTGQMTPTTEEGYRGPSSPSGKKTKPLNPISLALISGASFVARSSAFRNDHLKKIIKEAIEHKGFSFVDVLEPCVTFHNSTSYLLENVYELEKKEYDSKDFKKALNKSFEWDYSFAKKSKIPIGIFYKEERETLEETFPQLKKPWYLFEREKEEWKRITSSLR